MYLDHSSLPVHTEENIADAVLDLPVKEKTELVDAVVASYRIEHLPTGTLIVSRGTCFSIMYHGNDMNCHVSILVWCSIDESDTMYLNHEPGKSKPMIFGLDTYLSKTQHSVILVEIGSILRDREYAYRPRLHLISHPRYLDTVQKLIRILPFAALDNNIRAMCRYKYQPLIFSDPETTGCANIRSRYYQLAESQNPLAEGIRNIKSTSTTCIDTVTLFVSLLYEELIMEPGGTSILTNVKNYDVARLIRPGSPIYELYENEAVPFISGIRTYGNSWNFDFFFGMYAINIAIFVLICLILRPLTRLILGSRLRK